jgi:hypothetical protein
MLLRQAHRLTPDDGGSAVAVGVSHMRNRDCRITMAIIGLFACGEWESVLAEVTSDERPPSREVRIPSVDDIAFTGATRLDQVISAWGEPGRGGPANEILVFYLETGERLWLSFTPSEPKTLTRAILLSNSLWPATTILFNDLEKTKTRRRDQLDFSRTVTADEVNAAWGPPDNVVGSGIEHWVYSLANGETARLVFDGNRVVGSGRARRGRQAPGRSAN